MKNKYDELNSVEINNFEEKNKEDIKSYYYKNGHNIKTYLNVFFTNTIKVTKKNKKGPEQPYKKYN